MEPILIVFVLALLAGMVLGPIFGFVAWLTSRENRRRLEAVQDQGAQLLQLQRQVSELEQRLAEDGEGAGGPEPTPAGDLPVEARTAAPAGDLPVEARAAAPPERTVAEDSPGKAGPTPSQPPVAPPPAAPPSGEPPPSDLGSSTGGDGPKIDWERWIGLRGAAVLGGVVLALAALLFLKYSIDAGYLKPVVRVALAVFAGLGALVGSLALRRRGYETTANALAGAGIVTLYGAVWAAKALYSLVGAGLAYPLMILVTLVCGLYSWRFRSLVVAVLGLFGGFATPALLSSGSDNPIGLFGYILLLNLGLMTLARRRGWPVLALLSVAVTGIYQAGWIVDRMRGDDALLALMILGVFAALFMVGTARLPISPGKGEGRNRLPAWLGGGGAVSIAFALALHLSGRGEMEGRLLPLVALLALLCIAAQWLGRVHRAAWIPMAAVGVGVATIFNWLQENGWGEGQEWHGALATIALGLAFHLFQEGERRWGAPGSGPSKPSRAPTAAASGLLLVLALPLWGAGSPSVVPWVVAGLALAALLVRQSFFPGLAAAQTLGAGGLGILGFSLLAALGHRSSDGLLPSPWLFLGLALAACAGFQVLGLRRPGEPGRWADRGAYLLPLILLAGMLVCRSHAYHQPLVFLGSSLLLALLMVLAATRQRSGAGYGVVVAALASAHLIWTGDLYRLRLDDSQRVLALALQALAVVLLTFWPALAGRAFAEKRWAWYGAALAGPAWFVSLGSIYEDLFGNTTIGVVPLALGALSLFAAFRTRALWVETEPLRKTSLVWFAAVALGFVSLAIPLQLEKEWITVGWALQGLATLGLWKRLDHPGLKYFSLALLAAVAVRLLANPAVLGYHRASGIPVLNWLTYTYLLPAACLLGGAYLLYPLEVERRRPWEKALYSRGRAIGAGACGMTAILVVFAWINLSIADYFSAGSELTLTFERAAARDLTTSLAWGVFALLLLAIGIARGWVALRWISLAFLVLTIGKVFLYDLGELEDLYRVASLVGLAVSLILVSLVYQRFVFRPEQPERDRGADPATGAGRNGGVEP